MGLCWLWAHQLPGADPSRSSPGALCLVLWPIKAGPKPCLGVRVCVSASFQVFSTLSINGGVECHRIWQNIHISDQHRNWSQNVRLGSSQSVRESPLEIHENMTGNIYMLKDTAQKNLLLFKSWYPRALSRVMFWVLPGDLNNCWKSWSSFYFDMITFIWSLRVDGCAYCLYKSDSKLGQT